MLILLAVYLAGMGARVLQGYLMGWVGQNTLARLRGEIFGKLQRLSLRYFDKHEAGDLMSRLVNDVDTINNLLSMGLVQVAGGAALPGGHRRSPCSRSTGRWRWPPAPSSR